MTTNENKNKGSRNRRTRVEVAAELRARLAKIEAKIAGNFDETAEDSYIVTRLKRAIRRRETAVKVAETLLNGRAATDKSPMVPNIDTKIANAQKRVLDLQDAKSRAYETAARVPFDIASLRGLLETASTGETVEFPTDLYILPEEKSDAEHEAGATNEV